MNEASRRTAKIHRLGRNLGDTWCTFPVLRRGSNVSYSSTARTPTKYPRVPTPVCMGPGWSTDHDPRTVSFLFRKSRRGKPQGWQPVARSFRLPRAVRAAFLPAKCCNKLIQVHEHHTHSSVTRTIVTWNYKPVHPNRASYSLPLQSSQPLLFHVPPTLSQADLLPLLFTGA